jgi:hypothetical protein
VRAAHLAGSRGLEISNEYPANLSGLSQSRGGVRSGSDVYALQVLLRISKLSIPLCLHVNTTTARLQSSRAPCLRVCSLAARLQSSRAPNVHLSKSARQHRVSIAPRFNVCMPAARLPSSIPPYLYVYTPTFRLQSFTAGRVYDTMPAA